MRSRFLFKTRRVCDAPVGIAVVFMVMVVLLASNPRASANGADRPDPIVPLADHWWDGFEDAGLDGRVCALVEYSGQLTAGGLFSSSSGAQANRIGAWNGGEWSTLGGGTNGDVNALVEYKGELIAGGWFTKAGDVSVSNIARWDGETWKNLGTGLNGRVLSLCVFDDGLVAGGMFDKAGGEIARFVAWWDGEAWSPLGGGLDGPADALTLSCGHLVAAGSAQADDDRYGYVAAWDGAEWHDLGDGFDEKVSCLLEWGDRLVAGGWFTETNEKTVNHIAVWDGKSWEPLGDGTGAPVWALAEYGGDLIAGGFFEYASGIEVDYIARWDGLSWAGLDDGLGWAPGRYGVFALLPHDGSLYVGGGFPTAGDGASSCIARWDDRPPDLALGLFQNPYLTKYIDIYIIAAESLDRASLQVEIDEIDLAVMPCGASSKAWVADYELAPASGTLTIRACASDEVGNRSCVETRLGNGIVTHRSGGAAWSSDGRFGVVANPGDLKQDIHVLVFPCADPEISALPGVVKGVTGICMLGHSENSRTYMVYPRTHLTPGRAEVRFHYEDLGVWSGSSEDELLIEHLEAGPLESYIDRDQGTISSWTDRLGGFRLALGAPGTSVDRDPNSLIVGPCTPNPFTNRTCIWFEVFARQRVRVSVWDVEGRKIKDLLDEIAYPGTSEISWDGTVSAGKPVPSGFYFVRFAGSREFETRKILLLN